MSSFQQTMASCLLIGLVVGMSLSAIISLVHYRTAAMEYGDGQVLMLLLDTYPELTNDARDSLVKCLGNDGYINQWEYDFILHKAIRAVFYDKPGLSLRGET